MNNRIEAVNTLERMFNQTGPHRTSEIRQSYVMEAWERKARSE